ncbi:MAG TPA: formimidoylglutamate deiminase [Galbitalea sp.]
MSAFWCEHAVVLGAVEPAVRIEHRDGVITSVEVDAPQLPGDVVLPGLTLPGLANGHSHAFHRALRGRTHADGGTFWTWRETMYRVASALDPDNYFELATAVFAEMVLAGYTVVGEFHYVHHQPDGTPYPTGPAMENAIVAAADRAGIRLTLLDALYLGTGVGGLTLEPEQSRFADASVAAWADRRDSVAVGPLARLGAAIHSVRAVPPALIREVGARSVGLPLHAHVSEQPAENSAALDDTGRTPTELFAPVLGPHFTAVHATYLTEADIRLLGESRSTVCFCPTTERDLADGIGGAIALRDSGVKLSLGSDQHAMIDPFEELRGLEMDERLIAGERGRFSPPELLVAATSNGYASLGWNGGAITTAAVCDLVVVGTSTPRTAGAALDQLWLAATAADVSTVIVGGVVRVDNGRHPLGDVGELLNAAIARLQP